MIFVYSKPNCPNCTTVKKLLDHKQVKYEVRDVTVGENRENLLALLPSARSVPQVFEDSQWIGSTPLQIKNYLALSYERNF